MTSIKLIDLSADSVSSIDLPPTLSSVDCSDALIQLALYVSNSEFRKRSSISGKSRGNVSGSTRKIYRQKGTGSARHGSIRVPQFRAGGMTFPAFPRKSLTMNKRSKLKALISVFTRKSVAGLVLGVSSLLLPRIETRLVRELFPKISTEFALNPRLEHDKCLFVESSVLPGESSETAENKNRLAFRNLRNTRFITSTHLSIADLFNYNFIIIEPGVLKDLADRILSYSSLSLNSNISSDIMEKNLD